MMLLGCILSPWKPGPCALPYVKEDPLASLYHWISIMQLLPSRPHIFAIEVGKGVSSNKMNSVYGKMNKGKDYSHSTN